MKSKFQEASIYQVAKKAGVHVSTVSRALLNDPRISLKTSKKVKEVARQLRYSTDPLVSSFTKRQRKAGVFRGTLAWIDNFPTQDACQKIVAYKRYFDGAQERAAELGFKLENMWIGGKEERAYRTSSILRTRNIQGLLLAPQPHDYRPLNLQWDWFSVVTFGYTLKSPEFHMVTNHQYHTLISAFRHLLALGYRRIGFSMSLEDSMRTKHNSLAGFLVEEYHVDPKERIPPLMIPELTLEQFSKWYKKYKPEVIITQSVQIYYWCGSLGLKIPEDVGYTGVSLSDSQQHVSGLSQQNEKVGKTAVDFLVSLIERNERGIPPHPLSLLCHSRWLPGKTTQRVTQ
jgi:DNA-binding LacI/PurR family transcriptional regulator